MTHPRASVPCLTASTGHHVLRAARSAAHRLIPRAADARATQDARVLPARPEETTPAFDRAAKYEPSAIGGATPWGCATGDVGACGQESSAEKRIEWPARSTAGPESKCRTRGSGTCCSSDPTARRSATAPPASPAHRLPGPDVHPAGTQPHRSDSDTTTPRYRIPEPQSRSSIDRHPVKQRPRSRAREPKTRIPRAARRWCRIAPLANARRAAPDDGCCTRGRVHS